MAGAVDPVLLVLPALLEHHASGRYLPLDSLLADADFPAMGSLAELPALAAALPRVADQRGPPALQGHRLDMPKTLAYLSARAHALRDALLASGVRTGAAATAAGFVSVAGSGDAASALRYAVGMLAEYLPATLASALATELGVSLAVKGNMQEGPTPAELRAAADLLAQGGKAGGSAGGVEPDEDYSSGRAKKPAGAAAATGPPAKKSAAQKALEKVDTSKMKPLSSFFAKKS